MGTNFQSQCGEAITLIEHILHRTAHGEVCEKEIGFMVGWGDQGGEKWVVDRLLGGVWGIGLSVERLWVLELGFADGDVGGQRWGNRGSVSGSDAHQVGSYGGEAVGESFVQALAACCLAVGLFAPSHEDEGKILVPCVIDQLASVISFSSASSAYGSQSCIEIISLHISCFCLDWRV